MFESNLQIESDAYTEKGKGSPQTPHSVVLQILLQAECRGNRHLIWTHKWALLVSAGDLVIYWLGSR